MRQAVLTAPRELRFEQAEIPTPRGSDVRVRVEACGVCGSDRLIYGGKHPISPPVVLGHEYVGVVDALGSEVEDLRVGDRVAVDPNIPCGRCALCRRGAVNLCRRNTPLGIVRPGGFAEFSLVPEANAYLLPASLSFERAALAEPLSCCIRAIEQAELQLADTAVILGAGPMGLLLTQLARLRGASTVVVIEPDPGRRALAEQVGADAAMEPKASDDLRHAVADVAGNDLGADVVLEASGNLGAAAVAIDLARLGGTVVWVGVCPIEGTVAVRPFEVNDRELSIKGTNLNPFTFRTSLSLIEHDRIQAAPLISDVVDLDGLPTAIDPAGPNYRGKVLVRPGGVN